jgi:hypothetical protein
MFMPQDVAETIVDPKAYADGARVARPSRG